MTAFANRCCANVRPLTGKRDDANEANAKLAIPEFSSAAAWDAFFTGDRHLSHDLFLGHIVPSMEPDGPGGDGVRRPPQLRVAPLGRIVLAFAARYRSVCRGNRDARAGAG